MSTTASAIPIFPLSDNDMNDINRWFADTQLPLTPLQKKAREDILMVGRGLALTIQRNLPKCADRSVAIRKVREVLATALEAVVTERGAYVDREKK